MWIGDWGVGIGDGGLGIAHWRLGIEDWAQAPIPNPQSPIPILNNTKKSLFYLVIFIYVLNFKANSKKNGRYIR